TAQLDDAQHVLGIVGTRGNGDDCAVLASGLIEAARFLHRERLLHSHAELVALRIVEMRPFAAGRTIGRSPRDRCLLVRPIDRPVTFLVATSAATGARAVARCRCGDRVAHGCAPTLAAAAAALPPAGEQ